MRIFDARLLISSVFLLVATCLYSTSYADTIQIHEIADVTIYGAESGDKAGEAFATGDFDGDGLIDLAVSSAGDENGSGSISILWGYVPLDSIVDFRFATNVSRILCIDEYYGTLLTLVAGDFNDDEIDDLAIGTPQKPGTDPLGVVHIVYGTVSFPDTVDLDAPSIAVTKITAPRYTRGWLGYASSVGDINGDGYDDLFVSAPYYFWHGELYVIFGEETMRPTLNVGNPSDVGLRIVATDDYWTPGQSVACGDVNGDGFDDLLFGAPGSLAPGFENGHAHLIYGSSTLPDTIRLDDPGNGVTTISTDSTYTSDNLGNKTVIAEINGDEYDDMVISNSAAAHPEIGYRGEIYVIYGGQALPDSFTVVDTSILMTRLFGTDEFSSYGRSMAASDLTGNGIADLIIRVDNSHVLDQIIVYHGSDAIRDSVFLATDTTVTVYQGQLDDDWLGYGLGGGDVNNDGLNDLLVGAFWAPALGRQSAGRAYVVYGPDSSVLATRRVNHPPFILRPNYPNPFSEFTAIEYVLPAGSDVTIAVYNVRGQLVYSTTQSRRPAGANIFRWTGVDRTGRRAPSGIYFYRVEIPGQAALTRKAVLLR